MTGPAARAHLVKAQEFLLAAELTLDQGLFNAAASNAVSCGINAKDTICHSLTGRSGAHQDHQQAVAELRDSGPAGAALAPTLRRLLALKTKSQYQAAPVGRAEATRAVEWAGRLHDRALEVVTA
ncbi:MAG: HEPN domain-containing protein [Acidimicrobiia bacterium]